jgi:DNA-binding GntR family transcriptional regulator
MVMFKTKNKMVYDYVKESILNGKYVPGEKINPKELALQLEISPVPVRDAINKLSTEGLITVIPHIGAMVADLKRSEAREIHMIRTELECFAVRLRGSTMTPDQIRKLEKIVDESEQAAKLAKFERCKKLNKQFHLALYEDSPYQLLVDMIRQLYNKLQMVSYVPFTHERAERNNTEHRLILAALKKNDPEQVCERLRAHRTRAFREIYQERGLGGGTGSVDPDPRR